jgi:glycosyltransferase involved in cell wall biosynthesis
VNGNEAHGRRLRVLTLVDGLRMAGGGERFAALTSTHLDRRRFESHLCVSRWDDALAASPAGREAVDELEKAGVSLLPLRRRSRWQVWAWRSLYEYLRERRIDVVHSHKFGSNAWGAAIGRLARVPVVVAHEHSWAFEGDRVRRLVDSHFIARLADCVIAVSSEDRRRMIEIEGMDPKKVVVIPTGIAAASPAKPPRDVRAELGIGPDRPVIGAVGGLRPEKSLGTLLEATRRLADDFPRLRVLFCGDGEERGRLEELAADLGVGDAAVFLGWRADVPDVVAALDVAVCCSTREGSPLSVLEYMDGGKPVVASDVGGIPDLIEDGDSGLLVPPGEPVALAGALARLLRDAELRDRLGRRGKERRELSFGLETVVGQIEDLYERLYAHRAEGSYAP